MPPNTGSRPGGKQRPAQFINKLLAPFPGATSECCIISSQSFLVSLLAENPWLLAEVCEKITQGHPVVVWGGFFDRNSQLAKAKAALVS